MAHPSRSEWAETIAAETGAQIVWDEKTHPWDTGKRALLSGEGSHVMVLQDDVILSERLVEVAAELIEYSGEHPVGLYAGAGPRVRAAHALNPGVWWAGIGPIWGPAVIIPTTAVPRLVDFGDRKVSRSYDIRLWQWFMAQGVSCYYTNPSLVDHRVGHGSLISKGRDRSAERFGSGVGFDWSVEPPYLEGRTLFPKVTVYRDGQKKIVRKGTISYKQAVNAGFVEKPPA